MLQTLRAPVKTGRGDFAIAPAAVPPLPWFPVIMLHRVVEQAPRPNPYNLCISQTDLARLIGYLRGNNFDIVTLEDAIEAWQRGEDVSRKACLTFDDGYEDFYTHAWPVLDRLDCPASVYLITNLLGQTNRWDAVNGLPEARLLSEPLVQELAHAGFRFGSHSATHPHLSRLTPEQRVREIAASKDSIEALTQCEARVFVYPHHDQDETVRREVEAAGFDAACGGEQRDHVPYLLHRIDLPRFDALSMRFRLHGWRRRLHGHIVVHTAKQAAKRVLRHGGR
ncbi:MAG TPA: polysaccharide deacetylase family protein [Dehalococcoidia bacterium]|nr:polysaccharide deacetylase family protein [Dehalococcoidia bacterium]